MQRNADWNVGVVLPIAATFDAICGCCGYYALPIFITVFSALKSGERIGSVGWVTVFMGFSGVLLILRPSVDACNF